METATKPLKILIVSDAWHPQVNGVVRTYEYLIKELITMGHEVQIIGPADFTFTIPTPGYPEIRLALFGKRKIRKIIEEFNPDHIHAATEGPLGHTARNLALKSKIHLTTTYHTHFPDYIAERVGKIFPTLKNFIRTKIFRHIRKFHAAASAMFVATKSLESDLKALNFTAPMLPLTRGVDTDLFKPSDSTLFKGLPKPIALYVGRVAIEKNIEAFLEMEWNGSKIIVGDGPSLNGLKNRFPNAHFVGKKEGKELANHYQSSDVFVFPSKTDTFGMVLIEAMACGLPIAGYNVTGPKDLITEDFLGAIDDDLSKAAHKALRSSDPVQSVSYARDHYSWRKVANQFLNALKETS